MPLNVTAHHHSNRESNRHPHSCPTDRCHRQAPSRHPHCFPIYSKPKHRTGIHTAVLSPCTLLSYRRQANHQIAIHTTILRVPTASKPPNHHPHCHPTSTDSSPSTKPHTPITPTQSQITRRPSALLPSASQAPNRNPYHYPASNGDPQCYPAASNPSTKPSPTPQSYRQKAPPPHLQVAKYHNPSPLHLLNRVVRHQSARDFPWLFLAHVNLLAVKPANDNSTPRGAHGADTGAEGAQQMEVDLGRYAWVDGGCSRQTRRHQQRERGDD